MRPVREDCDAVSATYKPPPRHCDRCGRPGAKVLDAVQTYRRGLDSTGQTVYICQDCYEREYPEQQPRPIHPGLPVFGGQYEGLHSKPNVRRAQHKWRNAVKEPPHDVG